MMTRDLARRVSLAVSLLSSAIAVHGVGAQTMAAATPASATSILAGKWEGNIFVQGMQIPVVITLDSAAAGWRGSLLVAMLNPAPITMASVIVKQDTVSMTMPEEGMEAFFQGILSADKKTLNGMLSVQGDNSGSFQVTKAAAPAKPAPGLGQKLD